METQRGAEEGESGKRLGDTEKAKKGTDRKIRRKVNPDTTLPLMTGVKQLYHRHPEMSLEKHPYLSLFVSYYQLLCNTSVIAINML